MHALAKLLKLKNSVVKCLNVYVCVEVFRFLKFLENISLKNESIKDSELIGLL